MNNVQIMANTFSILKKNKKKFIFATSQMSNMLFSSYGILKKIGENLTSSLGGLNVRFWNVYGYETDLEKSHVITDFILKSLKTNKINMLTDGIISQKENKRFLQLVQNLKNLKPKDISQLNVEVMSKIHKKRPKKNTIF